jgi:2-oxoglutarate dehydrogenase E1 component
LVFGMPHRGRVSVLANVFRKPYEIVFSEFIDLKIKEEGWGQIGDVKYHLSTTVVKDYEDGKSIKLSMVANPSHLECVNPVVYGSARAIQDYRNDNNGEKSFGVIIHGDAAFAGQGVVYESLQMADLYEYTSHGLIHVIFNNQVGFTTAPIDSRSAYHCTDVGKTCGAPIFHVNADEPDLVDEVMRIAV